MSKVQTKKKKSPSSGSFRREVWRNPFSCFTLVFQLVRIFGFYFPFPHNIESSVSDSVQQSESISLFRKFVAEKIPSSKKLMNLAASSNCKNNRRVRSKVITPKIIFLLINCKATRKDESNLCSHVIKVEKGQCQDFNPQAKKSFGDREFSSGSGQVFDELKNRTRNKL